MTTGYRYYFQLQRDIHTILPSEWVMVMVVFGTALCGLAQLSQFGG